MNISKTNFTLRLIQSTFNIRYPKNLCQFFWLGLSSYILYIFTYPVQLLVLISNVTNKEKDWTDSCDSIPLFARVFISIIALFGSLAVFKLLWVVSSTTVILSYALSPLLIAATILVFVGMIWLFEFFENIMYNIQAKRSHKNYDKVEDSIINKFVNNIQNSWIIQGIKSFKEKTCKIIQYHD